MAQPIVMLCEKRPWPPTALPDHFYEVKFGDIRILGKKEDGEVKLVRRSGED